MGHALKFPIKVAALDNHNATVQWLNQAHK